MSRHILELKNISFQYTTTNKQNLEVIDNISLQVKPGEFVSIIGGSGSGKSTLLQIIGGLIMPSEGEVFIEGIHVTGQRGFISYMPQQPALLPWRTVVDNVILAREIRGLAKEDSLELVKTWILRVGLQGFEHYYPHQLSGGMLQRVALLRALISPQEFMCLDEPFAALDALTRTDMQYWLTRVWEENKRSVLFVTHNIEEAIYLSDRIYVISKKPAKVIQDIKIPFSRPRSKEMQYDKLFLNIKEEIYEYLQSNSKEDN